LVGWGWLDVPEGVTDITNVKTYSFTWIDNVGVRYKYVRVAGVVLSNPMFFGKGEETGTEYEFDEIEHFAVRRDERRGTFYACLKEHSVTSDLELLEGFVEKIRSRDELRKPRAWLDDDDIPRLEANVSLIKERAGKVCRKCLNKDVIAVKRCG